MKSIESAIDSIARQTVDDWELLVVGNGLDEHPGLPQLVKGFRDSRIRYLRLPARCGGGRAVQRNHGNALACARIIAVADPGDRSSPDRAATTLDVFGQWDCDGCLFAETGLAVEGTRLEFDPATRLGSLAYRRAIALQHPYNSFFSHHEDYEMLTRLIAANRSIHVSTTRVLEAQTSLEVPSGDARAAATASFFRQARGWEPFDPGTAAGLHAACDEPLVVTEKQPREPDAKREQAVRRRRHPLDLSVRTAAHAAARAITRSLSLPTLARRLARGVLAPRMFVYEQYRPRPLQHFRHPAIADPVEGWPGIALVTPSYQQGAFIGQTLASVLDQDYPKLDYFVVDGGSMDETLDVLNARGAAVRWHSAPDRGQAHAINTGFEHVQGEIMGWLNSDDMLVPGALRIVGAFFQANPDVDLVYGDRIFIDAAGQDIGRCVLPPFDAEVLKWTDYVPQETMFWRRRLWEKTGPLDETFRFALDWDFLLRALGAGATMKHLALYLGCFRVHAAQKNAAIMDVGSAEMAMLREREIGYRPSRAQIHKAIWIYMLRHVARDRWRRLAGFVRARAKTPSG